MGRTILAKKKKGVLPALFKERSKDSASYSYMKMYQVKKTFILKSNLQTTKFLKL